jgi:hypothetical protein
MAASEFNFIEAYRTLVPAASREIVDARQKGHDKLCTLLAESMERVYETCRLAFQLPQNSTAVVEWFQKTINEFDPQFTIEIDKAEAGRVASLLLRDLMSRGSPQCAFAILVCSYGGRRTPIDGELLVAARNAITKAARERHIVLAEKKIVAPPPKDLKAELEAIQPGNPSTIRAAIEAVAAGLHNGINKTAWSVADAHQSLRSDVVRLAEEVDMLWWHIGDWSETLDQSRADLPKEAVGVVSGVELGDFVRRLPGPYGAYGILRRTLGKASNRNARLKDVLSSLGDDVKKLAHALPSSAFSVFPVHAAMRLAADHGQDGWAAAFDQVAGDVKEFDLNYFELAVQTFRERVLIKYGGLGQ